MNPLRRLIPPGIVLLTIITFGLMAYTRLEGWSLEEAFYMVVITLSTVGFKEVRELSTTGRFITMGIIITGVSAAIYAAGQVIEMIVEGHIIGYRRRRQMERRIKDLKEHYIICGFGRVGHQVAEEFDLSKIPYVVIDQKPQTAAELELQNISYIVGDITSEAILEQAGVKAAKGLIASADSDADNVFITLTAKGLNPNIYVIARAAHKNTEEKLKRAGADRVISPYFIAGKRIAAMATKPVAVDYLDTVLLSAHVEMAMEEFRVNGKCKLLGKTLSEAEIKKNAGAYIAAIRRADGSFNLQPVAESRISEGDILVAVGTPKQLALLEEMIS